MLGPVRFDHIRNTARESIGLCLLSISSTDDAGASTNNANVDGAREAKRNKSTHDEGADATRLRNELGERDKSIIVLRGLLAEKKRELGTLKQRELATPSLSEKELPKPQSSRQTPPPSSSHQSESLGGVSPPHRAPAVTYESKGLADLKRLENARDATIAFILKALEKVESELHALTPSQSDDVGDDRKAQDEAGHTEDKGEGEGESGG